MLTGTMLNIEFHPFTAVRMNGALHELVLGEVTEAIALTWLKDDARATDELRHDDTLGAVDDERSLFGHHREFAHELHLLFDLAGVRVEEASTDKDLRLVRHVVLTAVLHRVLRLWAQVRVERIEVEFELKVF